LAGQDVEPDPDTGCTTSGILCVCGGGRTDRRRRRLYRWQPACDQRFANRADSSSRSSAPTPGTDTSRESRTTGRSARTRTRP
jgi:hypothetical protein